MRQAKIRSNKTSISFKNKDNLLTPQEELVKFKLLKEYQTDNVLVLRAQFIKTLKILRWQEFITKKITIWNSRKITRVIKTIFKLQMVKILKKESGKWEKWLENSNWKMSRKKLKSLRMHKMMISFLLKEKDSLRILMKKKNSSK